VSHVRFKVISPSLVGVIVRRLVVGERFSARFTPVAIELVESELGPNGVGHRVLASCR
jgi:hypothetical protein